MWKEKSISCASSKSSPEPSPTCYPTCWMALTPTIRRPMPLLCHSIWNTWTSLYLLWNLNGCQTCFFLCIHVCHHFIHKMSHSYSPLVELPQQCYFHILLQLDPSWCDSKYQNPLTFINNTNPWKCHQNCNHQQYCCSLQNFSGSNLVPSL